jgi:non-heme chloroperoxidase
LVVQKTDVTTASGVRLAIRQTGPADAPPVVLVHGWAQSGEAWSAQFADQRLTDRYRLVAVDLRGHGESDVPEHGYRDSAAWAEDLAAVLDHVGAPALLVGWSYGGLVVADYLRAHGTGRVAGLVFVGAITEIGPGRPGGTVGRVMRAALPAALSEDPAQAVPALSTFFAGMADRLPGETVQRLLGTALRVPPRVRAGLFRRTADSTEVLARVDVPTLVLHGKDDAVVDPVAAEHVAATVPDAELTWYPDTGHAPFLERADEFGADLAAFAGRVFL